MTNGYEDIIDNVKTQNGTWMTSWLSDHTEKLRLWIPDIDKDTVLTGVKAALAVNSQHRGSTTQLASLRS